ncbi:hypothetical protein [Acidisoma silvae]|uniref:Uncharacterized protein n=1 Tax=Acidisoma silvae TaxID=2802396 RepID=A0A963YXR6_9PROT|nr:hypothetical protein [Acidisoma silvae]MCB8878292.1 hypothetical protein [Acidisoma silvae]
MEAKPFSALSLKDELVSWPQDSTPPSGTNFPPPNDVFFICGLLNAVARDTNNWTGVPSAQVETFASSSTPTSQSTLTVQTPSTRAETLNCVTDKFAPATVCTQANPIAKHAKEILTRCDITFITGWPSLHYGVLSKVACPQYVNVTLIVSV